MGIEDGKMRLCIYLQSTDRYKGGALYHAIVDRAKKLEIESVSVTQGVVGYGGSGKLHSKRNWCLINEVPVLIEAIDKEVRLQKLLNYFDDMLKDGMVTVEMIEVAHLPKKLHSKIPSYRLFYEKMKNLFGYLGIRIYIIYPRKLLTERVR